MGQDRERCPVKRYDMVGSQSGMWHDVQANESPTGAWVGSNDYAAMESRAMAAEARIRDVLDMLQPGRILYLDSFQTIRRILTRDPVPGTARKPEVTP